MSKYNRKIIRELDPRQCIYIRYNDSCTNLVVNNKNVIDRTKGNYPIQVTDEEKNIASKYPNHEAYRWFNMRGVCVVFRSEINENMFNWNEMIKIC